MKPGLALLALSLAACSASAEAQILKVLTLNFNSETVAFDDRHETMRDLRFAAIVDWVRQADPDIVLIQEGWNYRGNASVAVPLASALGYDEFYRLDLGFPGLLYDSDIVLAKRKFRMSQRRKIQLPHSAPHIGDEVHFIVPFGSITNAVGARLTLDDGEPLFVYSTHLLGTTDSKRVDQAKAIDRELRKRARRNHVRWPQASAIVAGDMNSRPDTPEMRYFASNGYVDTWAAAHPDHAFDAAGATSCDNPFDARYNPLNMGAGQFPAQDTMGGDDRIDYIYAHGPRVRVLASTVVFTHPYGGFWLSDHYGVMTTLEVGSDTGAVAPNPLTDSDASPSVEPTGVLELSDADFSACDNQVDCDLVLPARTLRGYKGFAVVNRASEKMGVRITGPAAVLPSAKTRLGSGRASSFVFMGSGDYSVRIMDEEGDTLTLPLHVELQQ